MVKVSIEHRMLYIAAILGTSRGNFVLRRWPSPNDEVGRSKHHRQASVYAHSVARLLECPTEVFARE